MSRQTTTGFEAAWSAIALHNRDGLADKYECREMWELSRQETLDEARDACPCGCHHTDNPHPTCGHCAAACLHR
jgi:hypothetical protein